MPAFVVGVVKVQGVAHGRVNQRCVVGRHLLAEDGQSRLFQAAPAPGYRDQFLDSRSATAPQHRAESV